MALRVLQYTRAIPANTPDTAPVTIAYPLDNWEIESIDLEVPPGPSGLMGFYIANNGVPWIPNELGEWIVWDDRQNSWQFSDQPNASGWQLVGYNTGAYDHDVIIRFHVNLITVPEATLVAPSINIVTTPLITADPVIL